MTNFHSFPFLTVYTCIKNNDLRVSIENLHHVGPLRTILGFLLGMINLREKDFLKKVGVDGGPGLGLEGGEKFKY